MVCNLAEALKTRERKQWNGVERRATAPMSADVLEWKLWAPSLGAMWERVFD